MPTATPTKVVDASAAVAWLFDEPEHRGIAARLGASFLVAPDLLPFEVANACVKKIRRHPDRRDAFMEAFTMLFDVGIGFFEVDHRAALVLSERLRLSVYDASYLWLARKLDAELITLDQQLADAAAALR